MEKLPLFIVLIPTPDLPLFYYMLGASLGQLLYGDVSVMNMLMFENVDGWFMTDGRQITISEYILHNYTGFRLPSMNHEH